MNKYERSHILLFDPLISHSHFEKNIYIYNNVDLIIEN